MKEAWEEQYKEKAPWNYDEFDKDLRKFLSDKFYHTRILEIIDLGCGNGSQVFNMEKCGFQVTGTDIVNALEYDIKDFIIDDALDSKLSKKYDVIVDRGLIHNLFHLKKKRHKYFEMIGNITHDNSYIFLKVLSPYEARFNPVTHSGPYRFSEHQLNNFYNAFGFECIELKDTYYYTNLQPHLRGYLGIYRKGKKNVQ